MSGVSVSPHSSAHQGSSGSTNGADNLKLQALLGPGEGLTYLKQASTLEAQLITTGLAKIGDHTIGPQPATTSAAGIQGVFTVPVEAAANQVAATTLSDITNTMERITSTTQTLQENINTSFNAFQSQQLQGYLSLTSSKFASAQAIKGARQLITLALKDAKAAYIAHTTALFSQQEVQLGKLNALSRQLGQLEAADNTTDQSALIATKKEVAKQIDTLRTLFTSSDQTLSSKTVTDKKVAMYRANMEKKLTLMEKKFELETKIKEEKGLFNRLLNTLGFSDAGELKQVRAELKADKEGSREKLTAEKAKITRDLSDKKGLLAAMLPADKKAIAKAEKEIKKQEKLLQAINKKLGKVPDFTGLYTSIKEDLKKPILIMSEHDAKAAHSEIDALMGWGKGYLNQSLTAPENWVPIQRFTLMTSKTGAIYVSVVKTEPIGADDGGVPAGLRPKKGFNTRPANFQRTTSYVVGNDGNAKPGSTKVSFRGGQFPTQQSAQSALLAMMAEMKGNTDLHINALLTPTRGLGALIKEDYALLKAHKTNILGALKEMKAAIEEISTKGEAASAATKALFNRIPEAYQDAAKIEKMIEDIAISNLGVNEGAVGEKRVLGHELRVGWHTSIKEFTNEGAEKLVNAARGKLSGLSTLATAVAEGTALIPSQIALFHNLGALAGTAQEMDHVWSQNDYANAAVGNNQFKLASLWTVADGLMDVMTYTDCMSGKDRTGEVEADAHAKRMEIFMRQDEHRDQLSGKLKRYILSGELTQADADTHRDILSSPSFKPDEVDALITTRGKTPLSTAISEMMMTKIGHAQTAMGLLGGATFMPTKTFSGLASNSVGQFLASGTDGISTSTPLSNSDTNQNALSNFPQMTPDSIYSPPASVALRLELNQPIQTILSDTDYMAQLKTLQHQAENVRQAIVASGSLRVTQENTGTSGFKVEGGKPLEAHTSGFNRDFVALSMFGAETEQRSDLFSLLTGLSELDVDSKKELLMKLTSFDTDITNNSAKGFEALTGLLDEVAAMKAETCSPKAKVKA